MLKIIAGTAKGRSLKSLSDPGVRPILARIKKSLFDIIAPRLKGARFLDIYAGTGAVGIEALSRGATFAGFIEKERRCARVLLGNLEKLGFLSSGRLFNRDALTGLKGLPGPFDVIFMGPPYKDRDKNPLSLVTPTARQVDRHGLLAENGLIAAQHHKKEIVEVPSDDWEIFRVEKYGDTRITFLRKKA